MNHLTLNSGHLRVSPRSEVSDAAIAALADTLEPGEHPVPGLGSYVARSDVADRALLLTVYAPGRRPLVTVGVAPDEDTADALWPLVERHYHAVTELPVLRAADLAAAHRPEAPWCAVIVIAPTPAEAGWLGDYERCVAWAWLERVRG